MARRGRSFNERMRSVQRGYPNIANNKLLDQYIYDPFPTRPLTEVEDFRRYDPDPEPAARDHRGRPARFSVAVSPFHTVHSRSVVARSYFTGMPRGFQVPVGIKFSNPLSVVACVRRKVRRAVLFAKGKRHKGSGARHRRRNAYSNVGCK